MQDMGALQKHINSGRLTDTLSDFHALLYLRTLGVIEPVCNTKLLHRMWLKLKFYLQQSDLDLALQIAKTHNEGDASTLVQRGSWQTLLMILSETAGHMGAGDMRSGSGESVGGAAQATRAMNGPATWSCRYCTFNNPGGAESCEMCGLPKE